jgi:AcrR family transcriptional regulator
MKKSTDTLARMSSPNQPRRRMRPELRRAEILDATIRVLSGRGYWGLTMAEVAKESGVTVQGVLHYFPSKDALTLALLERRDEIDIRTVAPPDHEVANVDEFIEIVGRLVERNAERPELIRLYSVLSAESLDSEHPAHEFFAHRFVRSVDAISALARQWHQDPTELAIQVVSALDGLQLNWLREPSIDLVKQWSIWASHYFAAQLDDVDRGAAAKPAPRDLDNH